MRTSFYIIATLLLMTLLGSGCSDTFKVTSIQIYPESDSVKIGSTLQLNAAFEFKGGDYNDPNLIVPSWKSDNEAVATVNDSGLVRAKTPGKAIITVGLGDKEASATIIAVDTAKSE
jgi:uncharacterized protein YjdB